MKKRLLILRVALSALTFQTGLRATGGIIVCKAPNLQPSAAFGRGNFEPFFDQAPQKISGQKDSITLEMERIAQEVEQEKIAEQATQQATQQAAARRAIGFSLSPVLRQSAFSPWFTLKKRIDSACSACAKLPAQGEQFAQKEESRFCKECREQQVRAEVLRGIESVQRQKNIEQSSEELRAKERYQRSLAEVVGSLKDQDRQQAVERRSEEQRIKERRARLAEELQEVLDIRRETVQIEEDTERLKQELAGLKQLIAVLEKEEEERLAEEEFQRLRKEQESLYSRVAGWFKRPTLTGVTALPEAITSKPSYWFIGKIPTIVSFVSKRFSFIDPTAFEIMLTWFVKSADATSEEKQEALQEAKRESVATYGGMLAAQAVVSAMGAPDISMSVLSLVIYALIAYLIDGTDEFGIADLYQKAKIKAQELKERATTPRYSGKIIDV